MKHEKVQDYWAAKSNLRYCPLNVKAIKSNDFIFIRYSSYGKHLRFDFYVESRWRKAMNEFVGWERTSFRVYL